MNANATHNYYRHAAALEAIAEARNRAAAGPMTPAKLAEYWAALEKSVQVLVNDPA